MKKETKSIQLDPMVLEKLMKIKKAWHAHSMNEVISLLIAKAKNIKPLDDRIKYLEQRVEALENKENK